MQFPLSSNGRQRLREAQQREEEEHARQRLADARCAQLLERREDRTRRRLQTDQALANQELSQEHKQRYMQQCVQPLVVLL